MVNLRVTVQRRLKWLTLIGCIGLAHWFFGNLYEAIVFAPNWIVDSPVQLKRLNQFFVRTSPTWFFMPWTAIAVGLLWLAAAINRDRSLRRSFAMASLFAGLAMALNVAIVSTLITKLFGPDYLDHAGMLETYAWRWNIFNSLRMALVGAAAVYAFNTFRLIDRRVNDLVAA